MCIERKEFITGHMTSSESTAVKEKQTLKSLKNAVMSESNSKSLCITSSFHDKSLGSRCITYEVANSSFVPDCDYDLGCMPIYNRVNKLSKTVTYFVVTEAISVFVEFHKDVSFASQYNAKLWNLEIL
jgi:hypothetical protein